MNLKNKQESINIKAYVRIKPVPSGEQLQFVSVTEKAIVLKGYDQFQFDRVFNENSKNEEIFNEIGPALIKHSLEGFNACVLAYGQTSSGKTFTMKGEPENQGIIPRTIRKLFSKITEEKLTAEVRISYLEIYNENIIDLLNSENSVEIREDYKRNTTISGSSEEKVTSVKQAMDLFEQGESRRKFASNSLNLSSSRSHTIFKINIEVIKDILQRNLSCINMVDLAGSEGVSRTKAEGSTKKQGENINKSILALSNVIRAMSDNKQSYINFRDSKLTRILQSSLCSNSHSVVICAVNPTISNLQQTINTLKFGVHASGIKLSIKKNTNNSQNLSQSKSVSIDNLQANERVEYQQNKRIISILREENRCLRETKCLLDQRIEFLQLQNHRIQTSLDSFNEDHKKYLDSTLLTDSIEGEREILTKQINSLKHEMNMMADKYEALSEYNAKIQKNERYLSDRIAKYESEIGILKETAQVSLEKAKTPIKFNPIKFKPIPKIRQAQEYCPLTIGSIVKLKSQIIELKKNLFESNEEIVKLMEERSELFQRIEKLQDQQERANHHWSHAEQKEIKHLHIRIRKLKNEISSSRARQKKLRSLLIKSNNRWIQDLDEFNEWYSRKVERDANRSSMKKRSSKQQFPNNS